MIDRPGGKVKLIGLIGAESTGKSTLALMLTGRLRTHGLRAELSAETGSRRPFPAEYLDSFDAAHFYTVLQKLSEEARYALRSNVDYLVADRTPFDLALYYAVRFPDHPGARELLQIALMWTRQYDALYYLPTEGAPYVEDGFRAAVGVNDWRERVDAKIAAVIRDGGFSDVSVVETVRGSFRLRSEYVYHHVLHTFLGKTRPLRAYAQIQQWVAERGWRVKEVRPQGSNSITRFHPSSDTDDIDAMIIVDGDTNYAIQVRADLFAHKEHMENVVQANLDLLVTPAGCEAHEV